MAKKMGRPRKELNVKTFKKLAELQPTIGEAASFFEMSDETLETRCKELFQCTFLEAIKKHGGTGKVSLRRAQWAAALKGNSALLIWLGKQWLGQMDRADIEISQPVIIKIDNTDAAL